MGVGVLKKLFLLMRSLLFIIIMNTVIFFYSFLCLIPLLLRKIIPLHYRYQMIMLFNRSMVALLKIVCGVNYKIEGLENIPKDTAVIVLSKHQSTWETLMLPTLFNDSAIILKKELLWVPFFGWGLAIVDPIAIKRSDKSIAMQQVIQQGKLCLDKGRSILVFPEGTRIPYGKIGNYRLGGARLAVNTSYPVIPVAHNAGKFWPRRKLIKTPGTIQMVIGKPIDTKNRKAEDVMAEVKNWIETTITRL